MAVLRSECDEVEAEEPGSDAALREAAGCLVAAAHLVIAHGGDLRTWLNDEVERLTRRLDHIEAGGTWESAKAQERRGPEEAVGRLRKALDTLVVGQHQDFTNPPSTPIRGCPSSVRVRGGEPNPCALEHGHDGVCLTADELQSAAEGRLRYG